MDLISPAFAVVSFRAILAVLELGEAGIGIAHGAFVAISLVLIVYLVYDMLRRNRRS